jgi:HAD superfamily hydrolase (TIGR01509 family)
MRKPSAVVFDLGKVLLDFDYGRAARAMVRFCDKPGEELRRVLDQSPLLFEFETGLLTSEQFFEKVQRATRFCGSFQEFEPIFGDIFTPIPEMLDLHARLRSRGIPAYIFSNTNELGIRHIRSTYPFFQQFDGYIFSYEHRSMKPDPKIYEAVERETKRTGDELLYIDDRAENIEQGKSRGWRVIHHTDAPATIAQVERWFLG